MHEQMDTTPVYNLYRKAMTATTEAEALAMLTKLIKLAIAENPELSDEKAKAIQLANIGYFTGYLSDPDQQRRVLALYQTEHPIFGTYSAEVTMDKAFKAGMTMGELIKEGNLSSEAIKAARKIIEQP